MGDKEFELSAPAYSCQCSPGQVLRGTSARRRGPPRTPTPQSPGSGESWDPQWRPCGDLAGSAAASDPPISWVGSPCVCVFGQSCLLSSLNLCKGC